MENLERKTGFLRSIVEGSKYIVRNQIEAMALGTFATVVTENRNVGVLFGVGYGLGRMMMDVIDAQYFKTGRMYELFFKKE